MQLKIFTILLLIFIFNPFEKAHAYTMFFDDFESENTNWTIINGQDMWKTKNIEESNRFGARIESRDTIISAIAGDSTWTDYTFEMDILPIQGDDKNIMFRWTPERGFCNQFHFYNNNINVNYGPTTNYTMQNGKIYHVKVVLNENRYILYVDDQMLVDFTNTYENPPCIKGSIGLTVSTGSSFPTEVWFDNVKVTSINDYDNLDVLDIKQTASPWASMEYDSANKWSPSDPAIGSWGCAITSANMVLNYQGYKKLPDGTNLDPGSLNNWLKNQSDGYVKNGWLNWLALTRLTMQSKTINNITRFDALEYEKILTEDKEMLTNDIKNDMPDILEVPNHFVVAKGISGDTFTINDPSYSNRTDLTSYSNSFTTLGRYIPSSTDLSYFMIVGNKNLDIKLKDYAGNYVGQQFVQDSIINDNNNSQKNGDAIKTFYLKEPKSGKYQLEILSSNISLYDIDIYFYNVNGEVKKISQQGISSSIPSMISISFDKNDLSKITNKKIVSFEILINDIKFLQNLNLINKMVGKPLINLVQTSQKQYIKNHKTQSKQLLKTFDTVVKNLPEMLVSKNAKMILLEDSTLLRNNM